ncbi:MAG: hypothetical protein HY892_10000 [Deltaproteobacteria bacterium]|nr:hypothetical protein [Deltaproteobacteria bacterium]
MNNPTDQEKGCYTDHGVSGYGVAVKLTHEEPLDGEAVKKMAEEMMLAIARKCLDRGAKAIGHIKSHIRTEAGTLKADTIGLPHGAYSAGSLEYPVKEFYLAVNSIVAGIVENEVRQATLEGIHEAAEARGFKVVKEKEHAYFDAFDFTTSKEEYIRQLEQILQDEGAK